MNLFHYLTLALLAFFVPRGAYVLGKRAGFREGYNLGHRDGYRTIANMPQDRSELVRNHPWTRQP